jgi:hypothetical protein
MQTSVALDGNPEPDLVQATGCKQPTLRFSLMLLFSLPSSNHLFLPYIFLSILPVLRKMCFQGVKV